MFNTKYLLGSDAVPKIQYNLYKIYLNFNIYLHTNVKQGN